MNSNISEPIPFNRPFVVGKELHYIAQAVTMGNLGGDGYFTQACCRLMEDRFNISKVLLTPSCTAALEMAAVLCDFEPGDEIIMPSYTFVSTASAFVREGAIPVFVDIRPDTLNIDENLIEAAITGRTKAICVVHYAGVACEMDKIMAIANKHNLLVIEDAAQGVNAYYKRQALGSIGHLGCYSFHETKNYISGEGGAICINDDSLMERAEIIRDKGTNRQRFFRGEVDKYTWVDIGSSYVPSEICSAFLFGQLEEMDAIADRRAENFAFYHDRFRECSEVLKIGLPTIPEHCKSNYHMYYLIVETELLRNQLLSYLRKRKIKAVFHYIPLHSSPVSMQKGFFKENLPNTDATSGRLLRLPFFYQITPDEQLYVFDAVTEFFKSRTKVNN